MGRGSNWQGFKVLKLWLKEHPAKHRLEKAVSGVETNGCTHVSVQSEMKPGRPPIRTHEVSPSEHEKKTQQKISQKSMRKHGDEKYKQ